MIDGNRVTRTRQFNCWNRERRLQCHDDDHFTWQAITTGNFGGFEIWLADPDAGRIKISTLHAEVDVPISDIGYDDRVFGTGGLDRALRVFRLPDENPHRRVALERRIRLHGDRDTRLVSLSHKPPVC